MEFQKGMDLSFIPELEDAGVQVKDFDGTVMDPLDLVQKYGVNSVRLRIWNSIILISGRIPVSRESRKIGKT